MAETRQEHPEEIQRALEDHARQHQAMLLGHRDDHGKKHNDLQNMFGELRDALGEHRLQTESRFRDHGDNHSKKVLDLARELQEIQISLADRRASGPLAGA